MTQGKERHRPECLDGHRLYIGKSFTTGPDGKLYQACPDQQFANLYWFRYDWFWFSNPDLQGEVQGQIRLTSLGGTRDGFGGPL